jgi:hypothetical protein
MTCSNDLSKPLHARGYDMVHIALWGGDANLLRHLISIGVARLRKELQAGLPTQGAGVASGVHPGDVFLSRMLKHAEKGLDAARVVFLLLLNVSVDLKALVCSGVSQWHIAPILKGKAEGFFVSFSEDVVPRWQRNDFESIESFLEHAKQAYLFN